MRSSLCVCSLAPHFALDTKVIILLHARESYRPTNTGRLLTLALPNSEVRIRGQKNIEMNAQGLIEDGRETLLFFPSDRAIELNDEFMKSVKKPVNLIVPDGSWRQASKVMKRVSELKNVRHVKLQTGPSPKLRLRKETKPNGLSTFEAVARALGVMERDEVRRELEKLYQVIAERTLWARAKLMIDECETRIPEKAVLESWTTLKNYKPINQS